MILFFEALKVFIGYLYLPRLLNAWIHSLASQNPSFTVKQSAQAVGLQLRQRLAYTV